MSGGGEPTMDIDRVNDALSKVKPPKSVYDPELPSFMQGGINSEEEGRALDTHYRKETLKAAQKFQGPTPQEQMQEAMRLIVREGASGRVPDPDYDIMPRSADAYSKIDINALALQRARDYADDLEQDLKTKGQDAYSKAERERIIANRQEEELKRLKEATASDGDRAKARDDRRMRLILGQAKLKAGSSLLSDEKTGSGSTLLTG